LEISLTTKKAATTKNGIKGLKHLGWN